MSCSALLKQETSLTNVERLPFLNSQVTKELQRLVSYITENTLEILSAQVLLDLKFSIYSINEYECRSFSCKTVDFLLWSQFLIKQESARKGRKGAENISIHLNCLIAFAVKQAQPGDLIKQ